MDGADAINYILLNKIEGLWNFTKYPVLKELLDSFGIDTNSRGIHTWWELDTQ